MRQGHHRPRPGGAGRVGEDRLPLGTSGTWVLWGFCADLHANNQDMPGLSSAPELRAGKAEKRKNGGKGPPANTSCVPQQRLTHELHVEVEGGKWKSGKAGKREMGGWLNAPVHVPFAFHIFSPLIFHSHFDCRRALFPQTEDFSSLCSHPQ